MTLSSRFLKLLTLQSIHANPFTKFTKLKDIHCSQQSERKKSWSTKTSTQHTLLWVDWFSVLWLMYGLFHKASLGTYSSKKSGLCLLIWHPSDGEGTMRILLVCKLVGVLTTQPVILWLGFRKNTDKVWFKIVQICSLPLLPGWKLIINHMPVMQGSCEMWNKHFTTPGMRLKRITLASF